ncbi:uncharacterized protein LOC142978625 [Anticarsia gemmatalis]|uniref:uncharacterized protein LOC142978625 n=1 Tax=Anticarsia gemmatalis TaxID=129554 RepID=UPI003F76024B
MFKFVVLCAFFAAAAAKPGLLFPAPITQYSTIVSPATTTISKHDTSVIHPSPAVELYSSAPLVYSHFIKKRSPQFPLTYIAPSTYIAPTPYVAAAPLQTPIIQTSPLLPAVAPITPALHLIKKRSAPLLPTTYYASSPIYNAPAAYPLASAPIVATSYASTAPLIPSTPLISSAPLISQPIAYTHLIKKRSAPLLNTYIAPAAYSHQSRFDLQTTHTPLTSISYSAPLTYASPLAYSHVY